MKFIKKGTHLMPRKLIHLFSALALLAAFTLTNPYSPPLAAGAGIENPQYQAGLTQNTKFGPVKGVQKDNALIWEGIPYGRPPVGELRWRAPQDPEPWSEVRETIKESAAVQLTRNGVTGSEDSLNLTIYRPSSSATNLPVLFYIHGGNNQTGASTEFEASEFVGKTNSVVVTVNHRLDVLGFLNLPALKTGNPFEDSGNYALLDLNKALEWVRSNIEAFGGNPANITISGFSAGGRDVLAILASPLFNGKFQQAVSFSGGLTIVEPAWSQKIFANKLARLVVEDNIKPTQAQAEAWLLDNSPEVRNYLYGLASERLVAAVGNGNIRMAAFPHLYADGAVLPQNSFDSRTYSSVPLILLDSGSEFSLFAANDPYFAQAKANGTLLTDPKTRQELKFAIKYGSLLYEYANAEDVVKRIGNAYKAPIYVIKVAWGSDPKLVGTEMAELWGAHHGIFLPLLIEKPRYTSSLYPQAFVSAGVQDLSHKLQQYFKNFLWQGNPNGPGLPQWNAWGIKPNQLIVNADRNKAIITVSNKLTSYPEIIKLLRADNTIDAAAKRKIIGEILNGRWFSQELDQAYQTPGLWLQK
jgi:para-nitrobenzyl esterase